LIYDIEGTELNLGDRCEKGSQLRPHVVWFGEPVPAIEEAALLVRQADILAVVGTSLVVYPAAGLVDFAGEECSVYIVDPVDVRPYGSKNLHLIREKAGTGVPKLKELLVSKYHNE
jgi:NAD-dependent deacetylase